MKTKNTYTAIHWILCLLLITTACRQQEDILLTETGENASLTLQFNMTSPTLSRSGDDGITHLCYEIENGKITPYEVPYPILVSRAGDGNAADGGGMSDLKVFIVDNENQIVARNSFTYETATTKQTINFPHLIPGTYTAYAYANTEGNDWFGNLPTDNETDFTPYMNAKLKPLSQGAPIVQNNRMPLTGKQEMTIGEGNNVRTVSMLRPVGKLTMTAINHRTDAVNIQTPTFGAFFPQTGWVFKHDQILTTDNPYHSIAADGKSHAIVPGSYHNIFETLLYESTVNTGFTFSLTYKGVDYTFQQNLSGTLQKVNQEPLLIKLYQPTASSEDMFLALEKNSDNTYRLEWVNAHGLEDNCFWQFKSAGKQQRPLYNTYHQVYLNMDADDGLSFSGNDQSFKYGGSTNYTVIGEGSTQLTYHANSDTFSVSNNGTYVQIFTYKEENNGGGSISDKPIRVQDTVENIQSILLTNILRNQHIQVSLIFK